MMLASDVYKTYSVVYRYNIDFKKRQKYLTLDRKNVIFQFSLTVCTFTYEMPLIVICLKSNITSFINLTFSSNIICYSAILANK